MDGQPDNQPNKIPNFQVKFGRFKQLDTSEKDKIKRNSKAQSTHQATEVWVNCLTEYLIEKD